MSVQLHAAPSGSYGCRDGVVYLRNGESIPCTTCYPVRVRVDPMAPPVPEDPWQLEALQPGSSRDCAWAHGDACDGRHR